MSRIFSALLGTALCIAGLGLYSGATASPVDCTPAAPAQTLESEQINSQAELDFGTFSGSDMLAVSYPTSFIWVHDDNGVRTEVWMLYKKNQAGGFAEPGPNHTSVDIQIDYLGNPTHADLDAFKDYVENYYDTNFPLLAVDQDTDFEIHVHTVTIL